MPEWPWRYRSRSKVIAHDTPSHASDHLCLIWKESIQNCRRYRADTACGTDGRTDRRTDRVKPIYPPTTSLCGGYNDIHFQYQLRVSQDACFVQIWWLYIQSITSYLTDKPNFLEFWVKMVLKVKVNDLHFHYQLRASQDTCLVQIWWFQLKSVMSYHADKVKFTDGLDGQTCASNDNTPSAWKAMG